MFYKKTTNEFKENPYLATSAYKIFKFYNNLINMRSHDQFFLRRHSELFGKLQENK